MGQRAAGSGRPGRGAASGQGEILDRFGPRLRQVHLSSLDAQQHHVPLTEKHEAIFAPLLDRCRDVPWILEAPLRHD